jgi:hypothetical protein
MIPLTLYIAGLLQHRRAVTASQGCYSIARLLQLGLQGCYSSAGLGWARTGGGNAVLPKHRPCRKKTEMRCERVTYGS